MRLRFLGTGTSFGVPVIGCGCATCTSVDPRDRRTRHGALLETRAGERRLLIDTPPELRLQLVRERIGSVDGVWYTHCHADHTHGVDDLRAFSVHAERPLVAYAAPDCARTLRRKFDYIFDPDFGQFDGTTRPEVRLETFQPDAPVDAAGFRLTPLAVPHGDGTVYGFRVADLGYITDAKSIPESTREALRGVQVLVLNALWYGRPHPTHLTIDEAVAVARQIGARRTFLTHLTHRVRHEELLASLPPGVEPAFDGLAVDF